MKNGIEDLRNHLFAQLERLGEEELKGDDLEKEIKRAKAVREVADSIIGTAKAETDRLKLRAEGGRGSGTKLLAKAEDAATGKGGK